MTEKISKSELENLSEEESEKLGSLLFENLHDRYWCRVNNINYVDPDIQEAKEITCKQFYDKIKYSNE